MTTAGEDSAIQVFDEDGSARMLEVFEAAYPDGFLDTEAGRRAARAEIHERHHWFRQRYVPWLQSVLPLDGARVLEIGAGNGSSTVALAEAGAIVDAVDVDPRWQPILEARADLMGVRAQINAVTANAKDITEVFGSRRYDLIAYMACLEHMTTDERLTTLRGAWSMLNAGDVLAIADTPNRLWYVDDHTSDENYFHWLPDDVAIAYADRTSREGFAASLVGPDVRLRLARLGRGVSYHELTIALGEDASNFYVSGEWEFRRGGDPGYASWWAETVQGKYHAVLRLISPDLPLGFLESELAVCLRKPD